ncbi:MAG: hypothetical protein AAF851_05770 [Myxococcota bacterium]
MSVLGFVGTQRHVRQLRLGSIHIVAGVQFPSSRSVRASLGWRRCWGVRLIWAVIP